MSSLSLIHGVVMARDEWPLLELAITHALLQHVDRVWVLDHASTDGTAAGLRRLCDVWGNRITVVRLEATPYFQEAATSLLLEVVNPGPDDWVYVFDADEFAITPAATSLRDILNRATPEHGVVRYQVDNWVAPRGFDDTDFEQYPGLSYRAVPNLFLELGPELTSDEIQHGTISFFDVPFASKVIVRGGSSGWLAAGSHALKPCSMVPEMAVSPDQFRVAHFPLLSRKRLALKVRQGRDLIAQGFHRLHGWQSQMLARFDTSGLLDDFWSRHSVGHVDGLDHGGSPLVVRDDTFSQAIGPTLALLRRNQRPAEWVFPRADADATLLLSAALRAMQKLQALAETLAGQQRFATGACAAARAERDAIAAERDAIAAERDAIITSCTVPSGTSAPALRVATDRLEQSCTSRIGCSRKVFGIGWAKTGTKTLGACFEILGLSHQGPDLSIVKDLRAGDLSRIMSLAGEKQAFEDWPWLLLYRELDEAFPGSLFVLTNRSPERWLRSYRTMLASQGVPSSEMNELRSILYGFAFPDVSDSQLLERFNRHNHEVRSYFRGRADDLLVVDWEAGCGWRELCAFLGVAIPERPFPWVNRGHHEVTVGVDACQE